MTFLIVIIVIIIIIIIGPGDNNGFYLRVLVRFLPRQPKKIIIIIYPWHFSTWCPYLPVHIIEVVIVCLSKRGVNGLVNISIDFMGCLFFLFVTLSLVELWSWCALCYRKCKLSCAMQFTVYLWARLTNYHNIRCLSWYAIQLQSTELTHASVICIRNVAKECCLNHLLWWW